MEKATEDKIIYIAKQIEKLPDRAKDAVLVMIDNFDLIEKMNTTEPMTEEEIQKRISEAKQREDYTSVIALCAAEIALNSD